MRIFRPKDGENWFDVSKRAREFINDLIFKNVKEDYIEEIKIFNNNLNSNSIQSNKINFNHEIKQVLLKDIQTKINPVSGNSQITKNMSFNSHVKEINIINKSNSINQSFDEIPCTVHVVCL